MTWLSVDLKMFAVHAIAYASVIVLLMIFSYRDKE